MGEMRTISKQTDLDVARRRAVEEGLDPDSGEAQPRINQILAEINEEASRASAHGNGRAAFAAPLLTVKDGGQGAGRWDPRDQQGRSTDLIWDDDEAVQDNEDQDGIGMLKAGPPRPGLVPQSGDLEHPVRWIRPHEQASDKEPNSIGSQAEFANWFEDNFADWWTGKDWNGEGVHLARFRQQNYHINRKLRGEVGEVLDDREQQAMDAVAKLAVPMPEAMSVFRSAKGWGETAVGDVFQDKGIPFTAGTKNGALRYINASPENILIQITVPKGTPIVPLPDYGGEVVLPKATRFKVVSRGRERGAFGNWTETMRVEVV